MRKRQTYLLTLLTTEREDGSIRGRIKAISSGKLTNFTSMEELFDLLTEDLETQTSSPVDSKECDSRGCETPQNHFS